MNQTIHILRKDLRRLRWVAIGWCALVGGRTFIATVGADIALGGFELQLGIGQLSAMLSLVHVLFLGVFVSRLIHDEPLVGRDAFWITRPISPSALAIAKLAFAVFFFVLVPLAGHIITVAAFGTNALGIAKTIPVFALNQIALTMFLVTVAVVTPSLTRYVLTIVAMLGLTFTLLASALFVAMFAMTEVEEAGEGRIADPTSSVVAGAVFVLTALAIVLYQYRARRLRGALTIAGIGVIALFIVPTYWPWSFASWPRVENVAAPADTPALSVSLDRSRIRVSDGFTFRRRTPREKQVNAPATASGVPPEFAVRTILARSRLELPGGVVLQNPRGGASAFVSSSVSMGGWTRGRDTSVEIAVGGARLLTKRETRDGPDADAWPLLLRLDEENFVRYRHEFGRLIANLDVLFERPVRRAALPLADGATVTIDNVRVTIVRVHRRATGCTVLLRRTHVESLFSIPLSREFLHTLVNKPRAEAVGGGGHVIFNDGFISGGAYQVSAPHIGGRGFVIEEYDLEFPARSELEGPSVDLDQAWVAGAELVILEMVPAAGTVTRTVTIEGFRMGS